MKMHCSGFQLHIKSIYVLAQYDCTYKNVKDIYVLRLLFPLVVVFEVK